METRARAALAMEEAASSAAPTPKRRKINTTTNPKQDREFTHHKTPPATTAETEERPTSDELPASSCCSSNGSVGHDEERNDLEVESAQVETSTCNCDEEEEIQRREMSHSSKNGKNSQEMESSMEANSHRPASTATKRPTEAELDEFFAAGEKEIQQRFQEKYNFDIVKDVPLEGRYEWVQLKP